MKKDIEIVGDFGWKIKYLHNIKIIIKQCCLNKHKFELLK